jgi:hypothetical protein
MAKFERQGLSSQKRLARGKLRKRSGCTFELLCLWSNRFGPGTLAYDHGYQFMKAVTAACVAVFILWVVDVNLNGGRYTGVVWQLIRAAALSLGFRI